MLQTLANVREKPAVEEEGSGKIGVVNAETEQKLKGSLSSSLVIAHSVALDEIEDLKALSEKREQLVSEETYIVKADLCEFSCASS